MSRNVLNNFFLSFRPSSPYQMYEMTISGQAFLWHQVRCMAGILFLIGNNLEKPEVRLII